MDYSSELFDENVTSSAIVNFSSSIDENSTAIQRRTRPLVLELWEKLPWIFIFSAMVIVAIVGNLMVIWTILAHRRMRTITNYFLLNLSVADSMMATFNAIFNFVYMIESHWSFGLVYCCLNNFITHLTVASSVFTLAVMCIDRWVNSMASLSTHSNGPNKALSSDVILSRLKLFDHCKFQKLLNASQPFENAHSPTPSDNYCKRVNSGNLPFGDAICWAIWLGILFQQLWVGTIRHDSSLELVRHECMTSLNLF